MYAKGNKRHNPKKRKPKKVLLPNLDPTQYTKSIRNTNSFAMYNPNPSRQTSNKRTLQSLSR